MVNFKTVIIDICGRCNASCPYCSTWNSKTNYVGNPFMPVTEFEKIIIFLKEKNYINDESSILLFNWGEPLLHPQINEIILVLQKEKVKYAISTNCSVAFPDNVPVDYMTTFIISMPGFSQASYDRVHGFRFDIIIKNIKNVARNLRLNGFRGEIVLAYHIYQFSIEEIAAAKKFCKTYNIKLEPRYAFICDMNMSMSYLKNTLDTDMMKQISKDLILYYVDDLISKQRVGFCCPQYDYLVIDERSDVLTCCGIPRGNKDYSMGNIFNIDIEQMKKQKQAQSTCKECYETGQVFWGHNPVTPYDLIRVIDNIHYKVIYQIYDKIIALIK